MPSNSGATLAATSPKRSAGQRRDAALAPGCTTSQRPDGAPGRRGPPMRCNVACSRSLTARRAASPGSNAIRQFDVVAPIARTSASCRATSCRTCDSGSLSGTRSVSSSYGFSRQCASRSGMPASQHIIAAGNGFWL